MPERGLSRIKALIAEVVRRRVLRVGVWYLAAGIVVVEGADLIFPVLGLGDRAFAALVFAYLVGLPVAVGMAWAFDLTPDGVKRTGSFTNEELGEVLEGVGRGSGLVAGAAMLALAVGLVWALPRASSSVSPAGSDSPHAGASLSIGSLAVLPFDFRAATSESEYLAGGLHDAVVAELGRIQRIRVVSRTSVMALRDSSLALPEAARALGVDGLVEGSLLEAGNRLQFRVDLYHGVTDTHIWGRTFDGPADDPMGLQGDVVTGIVGALPQTLDGSEPKRSADSPASPDAQAAVLEGRYYRSLGGRGALQRAELQFERAIAADTMLSDGFAGLAGTLLLSMVLDGELDEERVTRARSAAQRALARDPRIPEAWVAIGALDHLHGLDVDNAGRAFRRAVEVGPSFAMAHSWYGLYLLDIGRAQEALGELAIAVELDPLVAGRRAVMAMALLVAGRPRAALDWIGDESAEDEAASIARVRERTWLTLGEYDHVARSLSARLGKAQLEDLGWSDREANTWYWRALLENDPALPPLERARAQAALGASDEALDVLREEVLGRSSQPAFLRLDPVWEGLRSEPGWDEMLEALGLDSSSGH